MLKRNTLKCVKEIVWRNRQWIVLSRLNSSSWSVPPSSASSADHNNNKNININMKAFVLFYVNYSNSNSNSLLHFYAFSTRILVFIFNKFWFLVQYVQHFWLLPIELLTVWEVKQKSNMCCICTCQIMHHIRNSCSVFVFIKNCCQIFAIAVQTFSLLKTQSVCVCVLVSV